MELPHIGKNCQLDKCHSLDFLPVACPLCQQSYCGDHRLPLDHACSQWGRVNKQLIQCDTCQHLIKAPDSEKLTPGNSLEKHKASGCKQYVYPPNGSLQKINRQCTVKGCKDIDPRVGPIRCDGCDQDFCLRHPSVHTCKSLNNEEQRKLDRKLAAQAKLAKTFTPEKRKLKPAAAVKTKSGGMVELMKIKSQAKGNPTVPASSRIYLYIQGPQGSTVDSQSAYFDKQNLVGRALDIIADVCKVNNKNNTLAPTDPERLELYKFPEMTILDKSCSLEKCLKNLDTVLLEKQGCVTTEVEP